MQKNPARKHSKNVAPAEMAEIKSNKKLLRKLKAGHRDAKAMRRKFVSDSASLS